MSNRLDTKREKDLQPKRMEYALLKLQELRFEPKQLGDSTIEFQYLGHRIRFYPYSGWHTGKSIKDGRGIDNLLKQLK